MNTDNVVLKNKPASTNYHKICQSNVSEFGLCGSFLINIIKKISSCTDDSERDKDEDKNEHA